MSEEDTLKLFTNLNRSAVDSMLRELASRARQRELMELAEMLDQSEDRGTGDLIGILRRCLPIARSSGADKRLVAELEMIQMNLEKLKGDDRWENQDS